MANYKYMPGTCSSLPTWKVGRVRHPDRRACGARPAEQGCRIK